MSEKKRSEKETDNMFSLAQREAVIKQLKKENIQIKGQIAKTKNKYQELKSLNSSNQENIKDSRNRRMEARN